MHMYPESHVIIIVKLYMMVATNNTWNFVFRFRRSVYVFVYVCVFILLSNENESNTNCVLVENYGKLWFEKRLPS